MKKVAVEKETIGRTYPIGILPLSSNKKKRQNQKEKNKR